MSARLQDARPGWLLLLAVLNPGSAPEPDSPDERWDERELARRVPDDLEAFQVIYERYYEAILNFLHRRCGDRDLAEDLASQTFMRALEFLMTQPRDLNVRPWLYRVALNCWIGHCRHHRTLREKAAELLERFLGAASPPPAEALSEAQQLALIRAEIQRLPPRHRDALLLRFDEEMSYPEMALVLGIEETGVRTRVHRGLQQLRQRLARIPGLEDLIGE